MSTTLGSAPTNEDVLLRVIAAFDAGDPVAPSAVRALEGLDGVDTATVYLQDDTHGFRFVRADGARGKAAAELADVLELVNWGTEPVPPGGTPGPLGACWLVPVHRDDLHFGVLAVLPNDEPLPGGRPLLQGVARLVAQSELMAHEARAFDRTTKKVAAFLPQEVVDELKADESDTVHKGGHRERALAMFVDLCGFTTLTEALSPERVVDMLNDYFEDMHRIVAQRGGVVDKHIGDAALLRFAIREGESEQAMIRRATEAAADLLERFGPDVDATVHIGAALGDVVLGNVGSAHRFERTVIGDAVNLAARLQGLAPPGSVAVDGAIERGIRALARSGESLRLVVRDRRVQRVRGRTGRVPVSILCPR